jgi:hypothetical protein
MFRIGRREGVKGYDHDGKDEPKNCVTIIRFQSSALLKKKSAVE